MVFFIIQRFAAHDTVLILFTLFSHVLSSLGELGVVGTALGTILCSVRAATKVVAAYDTVKSITADMPFSIVEFAAFF